MMMLDGKNTQDFSATNRVISKRQWQYIPSNLELVSTSLYAVTFQKMLISQENIFLSQWHR